MTPSRRRAPHRPQTEPDGPYEPATSQQIDQLIDELQSLYPDADCELDFSTPLELLIATILSAQSTDVRVNMVTKDLFRQYRSAADYANADPEVLEKEIQSTGFFRQKTKNLIKAGKILVEKFGGEVPRTLEELVLVPGAARKTANVVLGTAYGIPSGFVVDTHVKRLAYRLGLTRETSPVKVERDLMEKIPRDEWIFAGHSIIWHGRRVCDARRPACEKCTMNSWCPRNGLEPRDVAEASTKPR